MRRMLCTLAVSAAILVAAQSAKAFSLLEMFPDVNTFEMRTNYPVTLTFNASLNPATVDSDSVAVVNEATEAQADADVTLSTTYKNNDTVIIQPQSTLVFGDRYRVVIDSGLRDIANTSFDGYFPSGYDWFVPNVPTDLARPDWDPQNFTGVFVNSNVLLGFNPFDPENTNLAERPQECPGINATGAWKIYTGRSDVLVAAVDNGLSRYDDPDLIDRFFINEGELPSPVDQNGKPCPNRDCNGDGRYSVSDYKFTPPFAGRGAADSISPEDLIDEYSDGVDNDGNGVVDDICGYDFFSDTNKALGVDEFPEGTHIDLTGKAAVGQADNGNGDKPGVCPKCGMKLVPTSEVAHGKESEAIWREKHPAQHERATTAPARQEKPNAKMDMNMDMGNGK